MSEKLWRKNLINIEPYVAGEQPKNDKIIKLNANENPYPPSSKVKAILEGKTIAELRKYPSADASVLRTALAERVGLKSENVFCGNGSDDVLATAFRAFFNSDKPILYPDITYSFYPVWCELLKIPYKTKSVDDDFVINIEDFKEPNGGVVIPNPNAPTSLGVGEKFIRELLENNQDSIVIIDEAYVDFGGESCVKLLPKYENLVIIQTFSKSRSLAGARVGFAIASPELIADMNRIKYSFNPYNVNRLSILAGAAAMRDWDYTKECTGRICKTREKTTEALRALGFTVLDSKTNFIFAKSGDMPGKVYFDGLREAGILVRRWDSERIKDYVRISIGSEEEMETFVEETKKLVEAARSAVVR